MKHLFTALLSALIISFCCGFEESSRIIRVHNDGTGEIYVRVLKNPKNLEEGTKVHDDAALKKVAYGEGVEYVISTEIKGKNGWVGYLAKYKFNDVSKLRIFPASMPSTYKEKIISNEEPTYQSGWKFEIIGGGGGVENEFIDTEAEKKGEEPKPEPKDGEEEKTEEPTVGAVTFTIIPLTEEFATDGDGEFEGEDEKLEVPEDLNIKLMQTGRRYVTYIKFDAPVDEKASTIPGNHFSKLQKNTVVLYDEQFITMWTTPAARARISEVGGEPDFAAYIRDASKVNGYRSVMSKSNVILK